MPLVFNKAVSSDLRDLQAEKSTAADESICFSLQRCQKRHGHSNWKTRQQCLRSGKGWITHMGLQVFIQPCIMFCSTVVGNSVQKYMWIFNGQGGIKNKAAFDWNLQTTENDVRKHEGSLGHCLQNILQHGKALMYKCMKQADTWKLLPYLHNPIFPLRWTISVIVKEECLYTPWAKLQNSKGGEWSSPLMMPYHWLSYWKQMPCPLLTLLPNELVSYDVSLKYHFSFSFAQPHSVVKGNNIPHELPLLQIKLHQFLQLLSLRLALQTT